MKNCCTEPGLTYFIFFQKWDFLKYQILRGLPCTFIVSKKYKLTGKHTAQLQHFVDTPINIARAANAICPAFWHVSWLQEETLILNSSRFILTMILDKQTLYALFQQAHNFEMTLYWHRCDVSTSYWHQYDIISKLCDCLAVMLYKLKPDTLLIWPSDRSQFIWDKSLEIIRLIIHYIMNKVN